MAVIGIIATLDTKGEEAAYLRDLIEKDGYQVLMLDSGLLYRPSVCADISRQEILSKAGVGSLEEYRKNGKAVLQRAMTVGLKAVMKELYEGKKIQGVISIGGAQGSAVSAAAMQVLPVGFPKVMISTIACGTTRFGDYVGSRDIAMIPSIVDICGLNSITIPVFREGAGMVMGMVRMRELALAENDALEEKPTAALTMAGVTTDCVMRVKKLLEKRGFETIVCHCNGVGAEIIDEMAEAGKLAGVIDITPHEVGGMLWDGLIQCRKGRFENVYNSGIPVITLPGALDFILKGPKEELTEEYKNRPCYEHTPFHTHIRTNYREMYQAGEYIARCHNRCTGSNEILIPQRGFSQQNKEGGSLYDREADRGFMDGVLENKSSSVRCVTVDMHINDPAFAEKIAEEFERLLCSGRKAGKPGT